MPKAVSYNHVRESIKKGYRINDDQLNELIKYAQLWHNPLNYDNGDALWVEYEFMGLMFNEALEKEGMGHRYYFDFRKHDMTDPNTVMFLFLRNKNFRKYIPVWKKHAPVKISSSWIYLLAVTEMSVKGFKHEAEVVEKLKEDGHEVRYGTAAEDLKGVDIYVNGRPKQIKSPATARKMGGVL